MTPGGVGRHVARLLAGPPTDLFGAIRADDEAIALHCVRAGDCALFAVNVILGGAARADLECWEKTATAWVSRTAGVRRSTRGGIVGSASRPRAA